MDSRKDLAYPLRIIISVLIFGILFVTILQVGMRFVLNSPLIWTDELGRFFLIWLVFIGAAIVSYDDTHLGVDFIQEKMSKKAQLITKLILRVPILITLIFIAYSSIELVMLALNKSSGALEIPYAYWRGAATVGSVLMIVATIIRSIYDLIDYRDDKNVINSSSEGN